MSARRWWHRIASAYSARSLAHRPRTGGTLPKLGLENLEDRSVPAISLVSQSVGDPLSASANGYSEALPAGTISDDGKWVVYTSLGDNVVGSQDDSQIEITSATWSGGTATITTATAHGLLFNDLVFIKGVTPEGYNGEFLVNSATELTFTYTLLTNPGAGSGGFVATSDVFLYNAETGDNLLISGAGGSDSVTANGNSLVPYISGDGNWIAFFSSAPDLIPNTNIPDSSYQLYLYERATGNLTLVSHMAGDDTAGTVTNDIPQPGQLALSDDGNWIAFISEAGNLLAGQTTSNTFFFPDRQDAFLYDRGTDTLRMVSHVPVAGNPSNAVRGGDAFTSLVNISGDGSTVVFHSNSTNLGQTELPSATTFDIFHYTVATDTTRLITHIPNDPNTPVTNPTGSDFFGVSMSDDGKWVAYVSPDTNLVAGQVDTGAPFPTLDVFLYDAQSNSSRLLTRKFGTVATSDAPPLLAGISGSPPVVSGDGKWVAFASNADELLSTTITNPLLADNIYLYDVTQQTSVLVSHTTASETEPASGTFPSISNDGAYVVFSGVNAAGTRPTLIKYTASDRSISEVAALADDSSGVGLGFGMLSGDGSTVVFNSVATDLVQNDNNDTQDVFIDRASEGPSDMFLTQEEAPALPSTFFTQIVTVGDPNTTYIYQLIDTPNFPDNDLFIIQNDQLRTGPNFPTPGKETYTIRIRTSDPTNPLLFRDETFTIQLIHAPTDVALTQETLVPATPSTFFTQITSIVGDPGRTYITQLPPGVQDNDLFIIQNGQISTGPNFPVAGKDTYTIQVQVQDQQFPGLTYTETFILTLVTAPTDVVLTEPTEVPATPSTFFTQISAIVGDPNSTYTTTLSGPDAALFIIQNGQISTGPNFPTAGQDTYTIQIQVQDDDFPSLSYTETFIFTLITAPTDVSLTQETLVPATPSTFFTQISAIVGDPNSTYTTTLLGPDSSLFTLVGDQIFTGPNFPVAGQDTYTIQIQVQDDEFPSLSYTETFILTLVTGPTDVELTEPTEVPATPSTFFTQISAIVGDPNSTYTTTLLGPDAGLFTLVGDQIFTGPNFPVAGQDTYTVQVQVQDDEFPGLTYTETFTFTLITAPTDVELTEPTEVPATPSTFFTQISAIVGDPNSTYTTTLLGPDAALFIIQNGQIFTGPNFPVAGQDTYTVQVQVQDDEFPSLSYTETFTFTLIAAPTDISLSNSAVSASAGALVGALSVPASARTYAYTLVPGSGDTDNGFFVIDSGGNLVTDSDIPANVSATYTVRVRATDPEFPNLWFEESFSITATPSATTPSLSVSPQAIAFEGQSAPLGVIANPTTPGSEVTVVIAGVPANATLSAGTNLGGGVWSLTQSQLGSLSIFLPDNATFTLAVSATAAFPGGPPSAPATGSILVAIQNIPPTVTVSAPPVFDATAPVAISVSTGDPGPDTVQSVTVDWGDGTVETFIGAAGQYVHQYPLADAQYVIQVSVTDEDGTFAAPTPTVVDAELPTPNDAVVAELYQDLLGRDADPAGLDNYSSLLDAGVPLETVIRGIVASPEYRANVVNDLYLRYLGREADPAGLADGVAYLAFAGPVELAAKLLGSEEFFLVAGGGTNEGFLQALYQSALGREIDPTGLAVFSAQLASGVSRIEVANQVLNSPEGLHQVVEQYYIDYLGREGDEAGIQSWIPLLASDPTEFVVQFLSEAEYAARLASI